MAMSVYQSVDGSCENPPRHPRCKKPRCSLDPPSPAHAAAGEGDFESHDCPAALVRAAVTTWYVDKASLADYTPK